MSKERLVELHEEAVAAWDTYLNMCEGQDVEPEKTFDEFVADYLLANGVIVPLLQTGQIIYRVSKGMMWEVKIWKIEICGKTISYIDNYDKSFLVTHIGKGVFLTREEAEAKLKEKKDYE